MSLKLNSQVSNYLVFKFNNIGLVKTLKKNARTSDKYKNMHLYYAKIIIQTDSRFIGTTVTY